MSRWTSAVSAGELLGPGDRVRALDQRARADDIDLVAIEPPRIQRRIDLARQRDHRVEPLAQPRDAVRRRCRCRDAARDAARAVRRAAGTAAATRTAAARRAAAAARRCRWSSPRPRRTSWSSAGAICCEQPLAIGIEHHRLVPPSNSGRPMKRSSAWTRRLSAGGGQRELLRRGLDRAEPRDLDERLDRGQRRQSAHRTPSPCMVRCTRYRRLETYAVACGNQTRLQQLHRSRFFRTCTIIAARQTERCLSGILS